MNAILVSVFLISSSVHVIVVLILIGLDSPVLIVMRSAENVLGLVLLDALLVLGMLELFLDLVNAIKFTFGMEMLVLYVMLGA